MSRAVTEILRDALELSGEARAALANSLLESLDTEVDADAEQAWRDGIQHRVEQIDTGTVSLTPWDEVKRRLEAQSRSSQVPTGTGGLVIGKRVCAKS